MYKSVISSGKKRTYRTKHNECLEPEDDQQYAVVQELLGNGRLNALCYDGVTRMGRIRGSLRHGPKKALIFKKDLIIVSQRDFEDKVDVIHKYSHDEASMQFRKYKMPDHLVKAWSSDEFSNSTDVDNIVFGDSDEEHNDSEFINNI